MKPMEALAQALRAIADIEPEAFLGDTDDLAAAIIEHLPDDWSVERYSEHDDIAVAKWQAGVREGERRERERLYALLWEPSRKLGHAALAMGNALMQLSDEEDR